jgi:hypothetical protein
MGKKKHGLQSMFAYAGYKVLGPIAAFLFCYTSNAFFRPYHFRQLVD